MSSLRRSACRCTRPTADLPDCGEPIAPDDGTVRIRTYEPALRTAFRITT